jgi:hypothetical protein
VSTVRVYGSAYQSEAEEKSNPESIYFFKIQNW